MNDIKQWFKNLIATNYFFTKLQNTEDISSPIVKAIKDKEIPGIDPKEVSQPIVEALGAIREAVEDKEGVEEVTVKNITDAKADLTEVVSVLKDILNKEEKDIEFPEQKEVEFDTKPIIKALEKIEKRIPKYEQKEAADYTAILNKAVALLERPEEKTDLSKIEKSLDAIAKTDDMAVIAEWLKVIAVKEAPEFPDFPRDKDGIPYFNPTRVGSGGSGNSTTTNAAGEAINPATEESVKGIAPLSGASANGARELTSANTWYAVPSTVPTSPYVLEVAIETAVGTVRWGYDNTGTPSATNGLNTPPEARKLGANQVIYMASSSALDSVTWTTKIL